MAARKRHLHHPHLPLPRGEYIISKLHLFLYFTYLWDFHVANSTCILIHLSPFPFFFLPWQSKHKEDTSTTRPILLDEPEFEIHSFPLHAFALPCVLVCSFFSFACLFIPSFCINTCSLPSFSSSSSPFLFFYFFKRLILSHFLFITP